MRVCACLFLQVQLHQNTSLLSLSKEEEIYSSVMKKMLTRPHESSTDKGQFVSEMC